MKFPNDAFLDTCMTRDNEIDYNQTTNIDSTNKIKKKSKIV